MQPIQLLLLASAALISSSSAASQPARAATGTNVAARQYDEPDYSGVGCDMSDPNCNNDNGHGNDGDCSCSDPSCTSFACTPDNDQFNGIGGSSGSLDGSIGSDDLFPSATAIPTETEDPFAMPTEDPFAAASTTADAGEAFPTDDASDSSSSSPKPTKPSKANAAASFTNSKSTSPTASNAPGPVVHHGAAPKAAVAAPLALAAVGIVALAL